MACLKRSFTGITHEFHKNQFNLIGKMQGQGKKISRSKQNLGGFSISEPTMGPELVQVPIEANSMQILIFGTLAFKTTSKASETLGDALHQQKRPGRQAATKERLQGITTAGSLTQLVSLTNGGRESMTTVWPAPNCQLLLKLWKYKP